MSIILEPDFGISPEARFVGNQTRQVSVLLIRYQSTISGKVVVGSEDAGRVKVRSLSNEGPRDHLTKDLGSGFSMTYKQAEILANQWACFLGVPLMRLRERVTTTVELEKDE